MMLLDELQRRLLLRVGEAWNVFGNHGGVGGPADRWARWTSARVQSTSSGLTISATYVPVVGAFGNPGRAGVLWYGASDGHWWR